MHNKLNSLLFRFGHKLTIFAELFSQQDNFHKQKRQKVFALSCYAQRDSNYIFGWNIKIAL